MNFNSEKKILIIRLSALGDTIHNLPCAYILRKQFPNSQIDWVVEDKASVFILNNPLINNVYVINRKEKSLNSFINVIKKIRNEHYDIALDFQQLFKSGLILGLSGAKNKLTLDYGREFSFLFANKIIKTNHKLFDKNYHVVYRNIDLVKSLNNNSSDNEIKFIIPDFSKDYSLEIKNIIENLDITKKTIVLAPATTWSNKHWDIKNWRDIIQEFQTANNIVISANTKEKEYISQITSGFNNIIDLTGKTSIADLVYLYKKADIIISPDSGSAHVAWACGAKAIITLFFSTSKNRTAPFGKNYFSLSAKTNCHPCMKRICPLKTEKNKCTNSISSKEVIDLIKTILK